MRIKRDECGVRNPLLGDVSSSSRVVVDAGNFEQAVVMGYGCGEQSPDHIANDGDRGAPGGEVRVRKNYIRREQPREVVDRRVREDKRQVTADDSRQVVELE